MGFTMGVATLGLKATAAAAAKNPARSGNCRDICCEAGEERYSKTITYDPSRSNLNGHLGKFSSGVDAYEYIRAETEKAEGIHRAKSKQGRGFRKDKSIAYAFIFKPEAAWVNTQDKATLDRFFDDSFAVACELGVFDENTDVVLRERHYDEAAAHEHVIVMAKTADGDLVGPEFLGLKKFDLMNHALPKKLREMGWDIDELGRNYDAEKAKQMTPAELAEYKAECIKKKRAKHGLSANAYIAQQRAEEAVADAEKAIEIAKDATELADAAEARKKKAERDAKFRERARAEMRVQMDDMWAKKTQAEADAEAAKAEQKEAEDARDAAAEELADMEPRIAAVSTREDAVKAREDDVERRESAVAESERGIAAKRAEADAVLTSARRDGEAARRRIEDEAEAAAEQTQQAAARKAQALLDEADAVRAEADDGALTRFVRWTRSLPDRGVYGRVKALVDRFLVDDKQVVDERSRRTARLRSQVDEIQRRGRRDGGLGY